MPVKPDIKNLDAPWGSGSSQCWTADVLKIDPPQAKGNAKAKRSSDRTFISPILLGNPTDDSYDRLTEYKDSK